MMECLATGVVGWTLLFILSTACVYLFPRSAAGAVAVALMLQNTDRLLRLFSLSIDAVVILITLVIYIWFVPGLVSDLVGLRGRGANAINRIKATF